MAKAASKHTSPIDWMSLKHVHEHVAKVYLSIEHVQRWIVGELAAGRVRWRWEAVYPSDESLDEFWQYPHLITVNWMDSSATKKVVAALFDVTMSGLGGVTVSGLDGVTVYGIRLALQDIEARLLAGGLVAAAAPQPSPKAWLMDAKRQNPRRLGEDVTAYAERLEPLMQKALGEKAWPWNTIRRRLYDK
jgi:hypothetical protein